MPRDFSLLSELLVFLGEFIYDATSGVFNPIDEVLEGVLLGLGVILSFCVANLLAAGDIVLNRSIVDTHLGDGLKIIHLLIQYILN